ncbi:MAG: outer membrane lipoprotein LolB [Proteobacteria bacterium]|nr:outer membrane lipoprotein LolB [Pseudomonadota bacterium]
MASSLFNFDKWYKITMKNMKKYLILLIFLCLSSCASWYNINTTKPTTTYVEPKVIESSFDISGRFFIKKLDNNQYGNFSWVKSNSNEELDFTTPLGQIVAKVIIDNENATLYTQDKTYYGRDIDVIMNNNLGFSLPLNYLHYWIQGVVLPNISIDKKELNGFCQLGWKVQYLEWYDANHPKIIKISRQGLQIKLLINR